MKKIIFITYLTISIIGAYSQNPALDPNWQAVFQDDFTSFNNNRWEIVYNKAHGEGSNEELQIYTSDNVYTPNGELVLRTIRQNHACNLGNNCNYGGDHNFTSGEIKSISTYKYGYFEIYAKIPDGEGYWPAFWLHSSDSCWYNEIDIFEGNGCITNSVTCNVHWNFECPMPEDPNLHDDVRIIPATNYSQMYHWYGLEWNANTITWYVDRQKVRSEPNDWGGYGIQHPMRIIINSALFPISWTCADTSNIVTPNYMYVDQVNKYRLRCDSNTVVNEICNYSSFYYAVKKSIALSAVSSLSSGQNIFLKATDFIELKQGFEVPCGAQLSLETTPCE